MNMTLQSSIKDRILAAQKEAFDASAGLQKGLDKMVKLRNDRELYYLDRIWVPFKGDVKAEQQRLFGLLQQHEIPKWKWEGITMDFVTKLPRTGKGHDKIWVIIDRLTKSAHFLPMREDYKMDRLARLYLNEIVVRHGMPISIIFDHDSRFTLRFCQSMQEALGTRLDMRSVVPELCGLRLERVSLGHELVQETTEKILQIKDRLKTARDRQKSYADKKRKPLEPSVAPRFVGPFEFIKKVCPMAYQLDLPKELNGVHDTFYVSNLKKCLADPTLQVPLDKIQVDAKLNFVEEPVGILKREFKKLKRSRISIVKGPKHQLLYRSQIDRLFKHDVYSMLKILSVVSVTVDKQFGYGYLEEIMQKLFHLDGDAIVDVAVALCLPEESAFKKESKMSNVGNPLPKKQSQAEFPQLDSGLVVPMFQQGEDLIECINKAIAFLSAVASKFPPSNNQLKTSSNPRNQATIQDGRVTVQQVQRRQHQSYADPIISEAPVSHQTIPQNSAFQTDNLDAYNSNCDDLSSAKVVLMANLLSCDPEGLSERIQPTLYDGSVIAKEHDVISMIDDEETLILEEEWKNVVNTVVSKPNVTLAPGMFKLDIAPISARLRNNRDAYEGTALSSLTSLVSFWVLFDSEMTKLQRSWGSRDTNLYTLSLDDMLKTSPTCLLSKASKTKSWLWHRHLSHLNFDAPSSSIPSTQDQEHSLIISQGVEESPKTPLFHDDPFDEFLYEDSTSQGSPSNVRPSHTPFELIGRWTKDLPIAKVIVDPSRSVSTIKQLKINAMWCYFDAFLTSVELRTSNKQ
nr:hypothetical protein [Tanacetum cinerariifolium]